MRLAASLLLFSGLAFPARAEIDGHGPDSWHVTGVPAGQRLNARMGPGTRYRVIETFGSHERGLQQVTCVPYLTLSIHATLTEAERNALPPRWCLMRSADLTKAGWVAQPYITPDETAGTEPPDTAEEQIGAFPDKHAKEPVDFNAEARLREGEALVQALYAALDKSERGIAPDSLEPSEAARYFSREFLADLRRGMVGHPLYGAQEFEGALTLIARAPTQPPRGESVVVVADFVTMGQLRKAAFTLSPDAALPGRPLRILRISHQGVALPK